MAQITLNSTGVASSGALVLQSNGTTTAVTISTGQVATLEKDAVVNGLTVGRGAGAVATNTAVGASALAANTTGSYETAIGYQSGYSNTTGTQNFFGGSFAGYNNTTGSYNTALGYNAYAVSGTAATGNYNTAIGNGALNQNTTASNNTAVGYQAGYSGTTATDVVALGYKALYANTNNGNTAIGSNAMVANTTGYYNAVLGTGSLSTNTTGASNTAIGYSALLNNTTASYNTAIGYQAGYANVTSAGCTYVGYTAGSQATGSNNTFLGSACGTLVTSGAKNTIIGGFTGNQGGLDIRTASNVIVLSDGDGNPNFISGYFPTASATYSAATRVVTMGLGGTSATRDGNLFLDGSTASGWGPVVAGRANGGSTWFVGSYSVIVSGTNQFLTCSNTAGGVYLNGASATSWTAVSDERQKENLVEITDGASKVASLRAVVGNYTWDEEKVKRPFLIAQDLQKVLPEAVTESEMKGGGTQLGIAYTEVIPLLVAAVKELKAEVDSLKQQLNGASA